jgi:hypothetical protein
MVRLRVRPPVPLCRKKKMRKKRNKRKKGGTPEVEIAFLGSVWDGRVVPLPAEPVAGAHPRLNCQRTVAPSLRRVLG